MPGAVRVPGDTGDPAVIESMVAAAVERFGRLDIAVANAATPGRPTSVTEVADDQWQRSMHASSNAIGVR